LPSHLDGGLCDKEEIFRHWAILWMVKGAGGAAVHCNAKRNTSA